MAKPCSVTLERDVYYPGQTINGTVECNFSSEDKARAIRVRFKGRTKVHWKEGRTDYFSNETYFEMVSDLLTCETTFPAGKYTYPFTFNLPADSPPSLTQQKGDIKYFVEAVIDRPWALDYKEKRPFTVHSYIDLNFIDYVKQPLVITEMKSPFAFFNDSGSITFSVRLPVTGYVPNQMVAFTAKVKNNSNINVQAVQFKLDQGFTFSADGRSKDVRIIDGQPYEVIDCAIIPGNERSWDLELRVPPEVFTEHLQYCNIIKSFFKLKGRIVLPLPHKDLKVKIPLTIGSVPLEGSKK